MVVFAPVYAVDDFLMIIFLHCSWKWCCISCLDVENAPNAAEGDDDGDDEEGAGTETEAEPEPELTDEEESIRANLAEDEPLPSETLDKILPPFWNEEPFRWVSFKKQTSFVHR